MVEYIVIGKITSVDDTEMLDAMNWLATNYGGKMTNAQATGATKMLTFSITETAYNDAVATITAIKAQYTTRLIEYDLDYNG